MSKDRIYYINARKLVSLQQVEIVAPSEARATEIYLDMANHNELAVDDYEWWSFSAGDIEIEDHGEVYAHSKSKGQGVE